MAVLEIVRMGHPVLRQAARALLDDEIGGWEKMIESPVQKLESN